MVVTTRRGTFYELRYRYKKRIFFLLDIDIIRERATVYRCTAAKVAKLLSWLLLMFE